MPLLHLESEEPLRWLSWDSWFARHQLAASDGAHDLSFNNYPLVIQAAIDLFRQWIIDECGRLAATA